MTKIIQLEVPRKKENALSYKRFSLQIVPYTNITIYKFPPIQTFPSTNFPYTNYPYTNFPIILSFYFLLYLPLNIPSPFYLLKTPQRKPFKTLGYSYPTRQRKETFSSSFFYILVLNLYPRYKLFPHRFITFMVIFA